MPQCLGKVLHDVGDGADLHVGGMTHLGSFRECQVCGCCQGTGQRTGPPGVVEDASAAVGDLLAESVAVGRDDDRAAVP